MVFEYCEGGDLQHFIKAHPSLSEEPIHGLMMDLVHGLQYLATKNIIHRDLKVILLFCFDCCHPIFSLSIYIYIYISLSLSLSLYLSCSLSLFSYLLFLSFRFIQPQNILHSDTSTSHTLKIGDFGFARFIVDQALIETLCGTPLYLAPEILKGMIVLIVLIVFVLLTSIHPSIHRRTIHCEERSLVCRLHSIRDRVWTRSISGDQSYRSHEHHQQQTTRNSRFADSFDRIETIARG
jgi:serine/threonine protein kinase